MLTAANNTKLQQSKSHAT